MKKLKNEVDIIDFCKEIAAKFKEHVLSKGGTENPMTLYKRFRGAEPRIEPLLERSGLV